VKNAENSEGWKIESLAISISDTVAAHIHNAAFQGWVLSCFPTACNLVDELDRVVSLVTAAVGDGPLNIVVGDKEPFAGIAAGMAAHANRDRATVGDRLTVNLKNAARWNPAVEWGEVPATAMATLWEVVQKRATPDSLLTFWVPAIRPLGGARMALQEAARDAAERLLLALRRGDEANIVTHVLTLAGLGPGSTPAGDDFLIGLMTGLRAWPTFQLPEELSVEDACRLIGQVAIPRTNTFSAAQLTAAREGHMGSGWHRLAAALAINDRPAIREEADRLLAVGATSGADAMAGFLGPYLLTST